MRAIARTFVPLVFLSTLANWVWADGTQFFCREKSIIIANFPPGELPFPDGTNITDQFTNQGLIFSADDSDLPLEFQKSLGPQENRIQEGTFFNLFRLNFTSPRPIVSVSVTFGDQSSNAQTHSLTAFDSNGNVVDSATFTESGDPFPDEFTLTVSSCSGIAFIVAIEQPIGAERLERITYTLGSASR